MSSFPNNIFVPVTKTNKSGVTYNPLKTAVAYAEDFNLPQAEIVAIETELGENPKGDFASVAERLGSGPSLKITYTGIPQVPLVIPIRSAGIVVVPDVAVVGQAIYSPVSGPVTDSISYTETDNIYLSKLTLLSFDDLVGIAGGFTVATCEALASLSFPELLFMSGAFSSGSSGALTSLSVPKIKNIGGGLTVSSHTYMTTLSFPELLAVNYSISITALAGLVSLSFAKLAVCGSAFSISSMASLTTLSLPLLKTVNGNFTFGTMASLTTLSAPELDTVGGNFSPTTMANLTTWSFPKLAKVGSSFAPTTMASLTSLVCDMLTNTGFNLSITNMASLATVSFAGMNTYGGTIVMSTGLGNLTSVTLGTIGTLKKVTGTTINISGQKLTSGCVNAILALLVSLDGTNGTTTWGAGKIITINGGTNGAPTGQGLLDKATLQARGATVTTN